MLNIDDQTQAKQIAWEAGSLRYKLQPKQRKVYDAIRGCSPDEIFTVLCSRGFGKTFITSLISAEVARRYDNVNILIISSTLKSLRRVIRPTYDLIFDDCPQEFQPQENRQDNIFEFPNGTKIHLIPAENNHIQKVRGIHNVALVLIDEAGFFGDEDDSFPLDHVIEDIILPTFLRTHQKARIIMTSTVPEVPNHPFQQYYQRAERNGASAKFTIYESDIPEERILEIKSKYRNENSWKREMLCEWAFDESRLLFPEMKQEFIVPIKADEFFVYYHKYFSVDIGGVDKTVGLFYYYDFKRAKACFVDELVYEGREWTTDQLAEKTRSYEDRLWGGSDKVYVRVGDNPSSVFFSDLTRKYNLAIRQTGKDSLAAMVSEARIWLQSGRVEIDPRCKLFIQTLKEGVWNKSKDEFARSTSLGHMDAAAAFIYAIRNIDTSTNPIPRTHNFDPHNQYWGEATNKSENERQLEKVFVRSNPFLQNHDDNS